MLNWIEKTDLKSGIAYIQIAEAIIDAIRTGRLPAGTRLPPHRDLAEHLGINVGTVSRAYNHPQLQPLLQARARLGTVVRDIASAGLSAPQPLGALDDGLIQLSTNQNIPAYFAPRLADALTAFGADVPRVRSIEGYRTLGGTAAHRVAVARWLNSAESLPAKPETTLLTDSAGSAIFTSLLALCRPGDVVLSECLTYPAFHTAAPALSLVPQPVEIDADGMVPDSFEAQCAAHRPRLALINPTLHTPCCTIMPLERRLEIVRIARKHDVMLLEDNVYRALVPDALRPPSFVELLPEQTIAVSSFSKTVAQGLRVGIIVAPEALVGRLTDALYAINFTGPNLLIEIAARWIDDGTMAELVDLFRAEVAPRQKLADEMLGELGLRSRPFSSHSWLPLAGQGSSEFGEILRQQGVVVRTLDGFAYHGVPRPEGVRLTLTAARSMDALAKALGIIRLSLQQNAIPVRRLAP